MASDQNIADWTPRKKWWMDLLKSFCSFALVALLSVLVLDRYSALQAKLKTQADSAFQIRIDALREFRRATLMYERAAHSAFIDLYQWVGTQKTATMIRYEQDSYTGWNAAVEESLRTEDDAQLLKAIDDLQTAVRNRHVIYDTLVDERLRGTEDIRPGTQREEFEKKTENIATLRANALNRYEILVLKLPRER
jgi:hypothetical protein